MKTYDSYLRRANRYQLIGLKRKAMEVMEDMKYYPFSNFKIGSGLFISD